MTFKKRAIFSSIFLLASTAVHASSYSLPASHDALIGKVERINTGVDDTIGNIQKKYDVGFNAIENANPHIDPMLSLPDNTPMVIPSQHLLPNQPRVGIVVNLPEMRMYYYPSGSDRVLTYPIGIGKIGKTIPITTTRITRKVKDPIWIPPKDIRDFNLAQGVVLPKMIPAGPDNPLGPYAIYMQVPTYLIHSTIYPESVGKRASFGCLRMYESDIEDFFPSIEKGIPVAIINSPVKVGWQGKNLYMEAHHPLEEHGNAHETSLPGIVHQVVQQSDLNHSLIDWQAVAFFAKDRDGMPHEVGMRLE